VSSEGVIHVAGAGRSGEAQAGPSLELALIAERKHQRPPVDNLVVQSKDDGVHPRGGKSKADEFQVQLRRAILERSMWGRENQLEGNRFPDRPIRAIDCYRRGMLSGFVSAA